MTYICLGYIEPGKLEKAEGERERRWTFASVTRAAGRQP